jgi:hypothetical protein
MRNEHDANLSLQPMERAPARTVKPAPAPQPSRALEFLRAAVVLILCAAVGVMLGLGA